LIEKCRVINGNICFHSKDDYNIYGLFQSRYKLFKDIYTNSIGIAIDYMVADALLEASTCYKYLEYIKDPSQYVLLTDCILENIQHSKKPVNIILSFVGIRES
jgi:HD superfamily phosphohydrolase